MAASMTGEGLMNTPLTEFKSQDQNFKKKRKAVRSYEIFRKHVVFSQGGTVADVSGIFSRECFLDWLSTRPNQEIKFPARSYQRVLYAHIRGADKRRNFPEPMEEALLKMLRNGSNPWKELFKNEKAHLGKNGFKSKGYHESIKLLNESDLESKEDDRLSLTLPLSEFYSDSRFPHSPEFHSDFNWFEADKGFKFSIPSSPQHNGAPWETLKQVLDCYLPPEMRESCSSAAATRGVRVWSPAIHFYLNQMVTPNDFRFSDTFLFPSTQEQMFRKDEPVGTLIVALSNIVIHEDENIIKMFRGSLLDRHVYGIFASLLSLHYSCIRYIPSLFQTGSTWRRDVLQRNDGSRMVCLCNAIFREDIYIFHLQDQSDLYPDVLSKPCFI